MSCTVVEFLEQGYVGVLARVLYVLARVALLPLKMIDFLPQRNSPADNLFVQKSSTRPDCGVRDVKC